jgi:hypothetical protein
MDAGALEPAYTSPFHTAPHQPVQVPGHPAGHCAEPECGPAATAAAAAPSSGQRPGGGSSTLDQQYFRGHYAPAQALLRPPRNPQGERLDSRLLYDLQLAFKLTMMAHCTPRTLLVVVHWLCSCTRWPVLQSTNPYSCCVFMHTLVTLPHMQAEG